MKANKETEKTNNQANDTYGWNGYRPLTPYEQFMQRMEDLNPLNRRLKAEREWLKRAELYGETYPEAMAKLKSTQSGETVETVEPTAQNDTPVDNSRKRGAKMPDDLKTGIENLSGLAMDDVNVHYDSPKPAELQALAYTQGTEIHLGPGQEKHLPHEAWHVVQQKQGRVQPTLQMKDTVMNDSPGLETEADRMGQAALLEETGAGGARMEEQSGLGKQSISLKSSIIQRTTHGPETPTNAHNWKIPLPPWLAGIIAHGQIETLLRIPPASIPRATKLLMGVPNLPFGTPCGFADLWQNTREVVNIAEIKSTATGSTVAQQEAAHYVRRHNEWLSRYPHIELDDLGYLEKLNYRRIPSTVLDLSGRTSTDLNLGPFWGDPLKNLHIEADNLGAVVYWCTGQGLQISPAWYPVFREIMNQLKDWMNQIKKLINDVTEGTQPVFSRIREFIQSIVNWGAENSRVLAFLLLIVLLIAALVVLIISIFAEPVSGGTSTVGVLASVAAMAVIVVGLGSLIGINAGQFPEAAGNMARAAFPEAGDKSVSGADYEQYTGIMEPPGSIGKAQNIITAFNPASDFLAAAAPFLNPVNLLNGVFTGSQPISPAGIALLNSGIIKLEEAGDTNTASYMRSVMKHYNLT